MIKAIYVFLVLAILAGLVSVIFNKNKNEVSEIACTMDAMMCPDGSYVGRSGLNCEFVCPPPPDVPADIKSHIEAKSDLIKLTSPVPNGVVSSPLTIEGEARGYWFFEASFPVTLTNWDGLIIAEGYIMTASEWMTEDFVSFTGSLNFTNPYNPGDPDFMKRGTLILKKDNPSGLPENDDALEIPIRFAP